MHGARIKTNHIFNSSFLVAIIQHDAACSSTIQLFSCLWEGKAAKYCNLYSVIRAHSLQRRVYELRLVTSWTTAHRMRGGDHACRAHRPTFRRHSSHNVPHVQQRHLDANATASGPLQIYGVRWSNTEACAKAKVSSWGPQDLTRWNRSVAAKQTTSVCAPSIDLSYCFVGTSIESSRCAVGFRGWALLSSFCNDSNLCISIYKQLVSNMTVLNPSKTFLKLEIDFT